MAAVVFRRIRILSVLMNCSEVTCQRGGISAHMDKDDKYVGWKELQARVGKVLLRVHKPGDAAIPEFNRLEFEE